MTIAVDFDGTIVEHRFPVIGKPIPFAFDTLKMLQNDGHKLILWTTREGQRLEEAVEYCKENGLEFYAVNSEFPNASWTGSGVSRKICADLYIDDKNIGGLYDWGDVYSMISKRSSHKTTGGSGHIPHKHHKKSHMPDFLRLLVGRMREARNTFRIG